MCPQATLLDSLLRCARVVAALAVTYGNLRYLWHVTISFEFTASPRAKLLIITYPTYSTYGRSPEVQQLLISSDK